MALDALNAVAGKLILDNAKVDAAKKASGVVLAAAVPGLLGLAVPFIFARQAKASQQSNGSSSPSQGTSRDEVIVPDLTDKSIAEATSQLKDVGLQIAVHTAFSAEAANSNLVIGQKPSPNEVTQLGAFVIAFVSGGLAPKDEPPDDCDTDLSAKIAALKSDLDQRMDDIQEQLQILTKNKTTP